MEFSKDMHDMFQKIAEHHNAQFRLCKTLVAGFKATNEQDLSYMDNYMDTLFDFMDPGGDTEAVYRDYLAHIATFNPQKAKKYEESLDEHLGYEIHVVFAAAYVARDLHQGQKDKGGNDYFSSHLLPVGKSGYDWKEQVVGLLHDAAEDTSNDISTILHLVKQKLETWMNNPDDRSWIDDFEEDFFAEKQVLTRLYLVCDTKEELAAAIKEYHEKVKVFDKAGNNMLLKGFDVDKALATSSDYVPQVNKKETTEVVHS